MGFDQGVNFAISCVCKEIARAIETGKVPNEVTDVIDGTSSFLKETKSLYGEYKAMDSQEKKEVVREVKNEIKEDINDWFNELDEEIDACIDAFKYIGREFKKGLKNKGIL